MTPKYIMIASSKGGVGKSTAALGIARAFRDLGKRVLVSDLDFGNASLDMLFGVQDSVVGTIQDVCLGRCSVEKVLIDIGGEGKRPLFRRKRRHKVEQAGAMWLLPSSAGGGDCTPGTVGELSLDSGDICNAILDAAKHVNADHVIIDTGAGVNSPAAVAAAVADTALVVAGQMPVSLRSAQTTAERLASYGVSDIRLVVNSFDPRGVILEDRKGLLGVIDEARAPLAGVIPYDYALMLTHEGIYADKGDADMAFYNIAERLLGESIPLFYGIKKLRRLKNKICL
ncbi:MAG: AAA family ATPase [Clostridia bacterium]|nr:AAA family ATPase [Clostridia bacterium]